MGVLRKIRIVAMVLVMLVVGAIVAVLAGIDELELPVDCPSEVASESALTVKGEEISELQMDNAVIVVGGAIDSDLTTRDAESGIMGAIQESVLGKEPTSDSSSSAGLFHQIDDWGPLDVRMDPEQATDMFYNGGRKGQPGLADIEDRESMSRGEAVQAVQRSAYPDDYDQWEDEAIAIVAAILGDEVEVDCEEVDPIEQMVQAALSRVGYSLDEISSSGEPIRVATYNVLGSNHTSSQSAMDRIATSANLIESESLDVVGLQELRPDQRDRLLELTDGTYDIYPATPVYGATQLSVNSIIWDTSRFELVDGRPTPMPFYFGGQRQDIPQVELRDLQSGETIVVVNTHDPAKKANARLRFLNAQAHADLAEELSAQGESVFFTGDFNSGFAVRSVGNTTYLDDRDNLTWCIMTRSGTSVNGYDDVRGRTGCPRETSDEMGIGPVDHVYVPRNGVETVAYRIIRDGTASDHPVVYAETTFDLDEDPLGLKSSPQFVAWAAERGGFKLPDTFDDLSTFEGSEDGGVTGETITPDDIAAGESLKRGDLVVMKDGTIGIYTGNTAGGSTFRVATWNIQVGAGYQARVNRAHQLIKQYGLEIIGFQEVENKAMFDALAAKSGLGTRYAIYPENPQIVAHGWIGARPIIYDTTRFEKVSGGSFAFPRMHLDHPEKQPVDFPLLRLRDKASGQEIVVMNVHFAAFKRYAKERYESGLATVDVVKEQVADGTPVVLTGDFNSNFYLRMDSPNPTYLGLRENMAYCQFTKNGLMNNAVDLASTGARFAPGSYCPRTQADGSFSVDHIYLSSQLDVSDGAIGEVTGTLSDHGTAPYADVEVVGAKVGSGEQSLGTYVGLAQNGNTIALRSVDPSKLVRAIRLTVLGAWYGSGEWVFPLKKGVYNYSSPYGPRDLAGDDFHNGADFGTQGIEAPLVAMHGGKVIGASYKGAWGNYLMVETGIPVPGSPGSTYKYMYAHLSRYDPDLSVGDILTAGDPVGDVGNTGNSFGEHLHLNICTTLECLSGDQVGTVDPIPFMASVGITP